MRLPRRGFLGLIPVSALGLQLSERAAANEPAAGTAVPLITSPPVVQHPAADGFTVHFAVSALATGWVEWHARVAAVDPDVLVWNGDTCNDFDAQDDPMQIVLNPNSDIAKGWASERPLLFVPGSHDVRGQRARELSAGLSGRSIGVALQLRAAAWPGGSGGARYGRGQA